MISCLLIFCAIVYRFFQHQLNHLVGILVDLVPQKYVKQLIAGCGGYGVGHNRIPCSSCRVVALQLDICGFTVLSQTVSPVGLAQVVHELFSDFDKAVLDYKLFKVDTIGDAYIVVAWLHSTKEQEQMDRQERRLLEQNSTSSISKVVGFREGFNALFSGAKDRRRSSSTLQSVWRSNFAGAKDASVSQSVGRKPPRPSHIQPPAPSAMDSVGTSSEKMEQHFQALIAVVTIQKYVRRWKKAHPQPQASSAISPGPQVMEPSPVSPGPIQVTEPGSQDVAPYSAAEAHRSTGIAARIENGAESRVEVLAQKEARDVEASRLRVTSVQRWALVRSSVVKTPSIKPMGSKVDAKTAIKVCCCLFFCPLILCLVRLRRRKSRMHTRTRAHTRTRTHARARAHTHTPAA
jgi:hypothetical protein